MLKIEKTKSANTETTTIGIDSNAINLKSSTAAGAVVGFLFAGPIGGVFGGLVGEVMQALSPKVDKK